MILRHTFTPPNNTRMGHLCGPMDAHIRTIEVGVDVKIAHRFAQFKIDTPRRAPRKHLKCCKRCMKWRSDRLPRKPCS